MGNAGAHPGALRSDQGDAHTLPQQMQEATDGLLEVTGKGVGAVPGVHVRLDDFHDTGDLGHMGTAIANGVIRGPQDG
eukprot:2907630-Rhodomonas_salina.1